MIALIIIILLYIMIIKWLIHNSSHFVNMNSIIYTFFQSMNFIQYWWDIYVEKTWLKSYQSSILLISLAFVWIVIWGHEKMIKWMLDYWERNVVHHNKSHWIIRNKWWMIYKWRWDNRLSKLKKLRRKKRFNEMTFA